MLDGYFILDADAHVRDDEPVLRPFISPEFRERPFFYPRDGFDRGLGGTLGVRAVDANTQIEAMDEEGIDMQVLFPTTGLGLGEMREGSLCVAVCRAYNDWMHNYCKRDPKRLKGVAIVPYLDLPAAVDELHRAVEELGLVAVMQPSLIRFGPRNAGDPLLDPFYAAAEKLGVPVCLHNNGGEAGDRGRFFTFLQVHLHSHVPEQMICVTSIALGGVLAKFPKLKVGFMEAGCGWLPFWLEHMDEEWEKRPHEAPLIDRPPSEYIRNGNCYFGVEPEESGINWAIQAVGQEALMYASDYPHWDSDWPNTARRLRGREDVPEQARRALLAGNAARFYNLNVPALTGAGS